MYSTTKHLFFEHHHNGTQIVEQLQQQQQQQQQQQLQQLQQLQQPDDPWPCLFADRGCLIEYGIKLGIVGVFAAPNLVSSRLVGTGLVFLGLFVMAPYFVMSIVALPQVRLANVIQAPPHLDLAGMLSLLYWSLSGFDSASTFAGEVDQPQRTYPRALFLAVVVMLLCYMVPLGVAAAADPRWVHWEDGSLGAAARRIGGEWLGVWVIISSCMSNWGLVASELLEDSYQLLGMAEVGLAPRCFAVRQSRLGTPVRAILLQVAIVACLVSLDFDVIMCVDNFFSAAAAALEFAAVVQLRVRQPGLARPFRIPLGTIGLAVFVLIPFGISLFVMAITAIQSVLTLTLCLGATVLGGLLYLPIARAKGAGSSALADPVMPADCGEADGSSLDASSARLRR